MVSKSDKKELDELIKAMDRLRSAIEALCVEMRQYKYQVQATVKDDGDSYIADLDHDPYYDVWDGTKR